MPLTTIDTHTALIVIDLQKGIITRPTVHPTADVVHQAAALARAFRKHHLPVVLVNVTGGAPGRTDASKNASTAQAPSPDFADLAEELEAQPEDHLVTKQTWGSFQGTVLDEHLKALRVTQVVLAGVSTSIGVESTARSAHELGYHVVLATDAMTDMDADAHHNSITRIFPRLGEIATTDEILSMLTSR